MSGNGAMLDLSRSFDKLKTLNITELKLLLSSDAKLNELIADHPIYRGLKEKRNELILENRSIAEFSLSQEDDLREAREKFIRSQDKLREMKLEFDREKRIFDSRSSATSLDSLLSVFQTSAGISQETSEHIGEQLVADAIGIDVFLEEFLCKSTEAHLRRVKVDKLQHFLDTGSINGNVNQF